MSMVMTCGLSWADFSTASRPSRASPTTSNEPSASRMLTSTLRMNVESSATNTRIFSILVILCLSMNQGRRGGRLSRGANQLHHLGDKRFFLHGLDHEGRSAFLHCALAML